MKVSQTMSFVHQVEDRVYHLSFPFPAPLGECIDVASSVCNEFAKKVAEQQEKVNAANEEMKAASEAAKSAPDGKIASEEEEPELVASHQVAD